MGDARAAVAAARRGRSGASPVQGLLFGDRAPAVRPDRKPLRDDLRAFAEFGAATRVGRVVSSDGAVEVESFVNEFWTARQRAAHSLHEVSYRACFKPQLPRFFIERLSVPGDVVYDPFMGRGTTPLEAALCGRVPAGCDVNPLSRMLVDPRLRPPTSAAVAERLRGICFDAVVERPDERPDELLAFYHQDTLTQICSLRAYLARRQADATIDDVDRWIRMVAVNRLTGHSPGFFSVYTMPPNQAVSIEAQRKINLRRGQEPPRRSVAELILRKTRALLAGCDAHSRERLGAGAPRARLLTGTSASTPELEDGSVGLVVTSPPFLDVVQYADDNWLRCWFCHVDPRDVALTILRKVEDWQAAMTEVFLELARVLRPGGHVAFEVGEVRGGRVLLEEVVLTCGKDAGLEPELVLINDQRFTKTANCWGIRNNEKGTNTNRVAVFRR